MEFNIQRQGRKWSRAEIIITEPPEPIIILEPKPVITEGNRASAVFDTAEPVHFPNRLIRSRPGTVFTSPQMSFSIRKTRPSKT